MNRANALGGAGKLLAVHLPSGARQAPIEAAPPRRFTPRTIVDPEGFEDHCASIRTDAYALNGEAYRLGSMGIAAPVGFSGEKVLAGLALHGPTPRLSRDRAIEALPALRIAAERISRLPPGNGAAQPRDA